MVYCRGQATPATIYLELRAMLYVLLRVYVLSAREIALVSIIAWLLIWSTSSDPLQYIASFVVGIIDGYLGVWIIREQIRKEGLVEVDYKSRRYILCARVPTMRIWKLYETGLLVAIAVTWLVFLVPGPGGENTQHLGLGVVVISMAYPLLDRTLGLNRIPSVDLTNSTDTTGGAG